MTALAYGLLILAAVLLICPGIIHWFESAQGMDKPAERQAAMDAQQARCDAHWRGVEDAANSALDTFGVYRGPERRAYRSLRKQA